MKQNGKIAWTTYEQIIDAFGCPLHEVIKHSDIINKAFEIQKSNKQSLNEKAKNLKLEEFQVVKKLGEGQFGHVFLVTDNSK